MQNGGQLLPHKFEQEDKQVDTLMSLQAVGTLTKVEKSTSYPEILRAYVRTRNDVKFSPTSFWRLAHSLDKEITLSNIRSWIEKMERQKKAEFDSRLKVLASEALNVDATSAQIRDISMKVFSLKIQEFLQNPNILDKMSFTEAKRLYIDIENLHLKTQEMNLKHHEQQRKDAFTLFSMGLAAGEFGEEDVDNLLTLRNEPENKTEGTV